MSRVSSTEMDIINIYCSHGANKAEFLKDLGSLARGPRPCIILGDFNIDYLQGAEAIINKITSCGFKQIVTTATHIKGGLLDHVYVKRLPWEPTIEMNFPYFTDHAAISVMKLN